MNTQMAPTTGHQDHPPEPVTATEAHSPVRRVGVLDRAAMHLGIALIRWGRRPTRAPRRERATGGRTASTRTTVNAEELEARRSRDQIDQYLVMKMTQFR